VKLAVGDLVVYARHGTGHVTARETRVILGESQEIVVLELADGLTVTLPIERAHEQLRPLASRADMRLVQETLRADGTPSADPWLKRQKETRARLTGGELIELARIVRDSALREQALAAKGTAGRLSIGERELSAKARQLLASEIALARGVEPAEADAWIDEQLTPAS
jgi:CarD family transcriptional regulator, regulator of rRNA transcription